MTKVGRRYNGKVVTKEELDVLVPAKKDWFKTPPLVSSLSESNPRFSDSTGVLPHQVNVERKKLRALQEKGELLGISILDGGKVEYTSQGDQGRRGWMRYRNKVDYDGGFGDTYTDDGRFGD